MKFSLRGASSAALIIGMTSALPVWAQQAGDAISTTQISGPQEAAGGVAQTAAGAVEDDADRVIVTGSFIQGTPEDAALPVEVFSAEELEEQGSPTALDFAKNLTISGPTSGESNYFGGGNLTGSPAFNLRGLGADKTLTLLNGRRMSENLSNIPGIAIGRTEILKDGAAVIYGADATGGVVNFITRDGFTGLEAKADYKFVDSSDGEYSLGILGGYGEGDTNIMWAAEWEHRSRLETEDRDFSSLPYAQNPSAWSYLSNLGRWLPRTASTTSNPTGGTTLGSLYDFTQDSCEAVGGIYHVGAPGGNACRYNYWSYYNLVEEQDIYRLYAQVDSAISDDMDFHMDVSYGQVKVPNQFKSPSLPTTQGPAPTTGATFQYYIPSTNPYVAEFAARTGFDQSPFYGVTDHYTNILYRPFAHNGNPVGGDGNGFGDSATIDNQVWRVSASLDGRLGEAFGPLADVGYNAALTYNQSISGYSDPDYIGFRLQEALNGFGGPNCNAADLDPAILGTQNAAAAGQNGCEWYNPFASSFANQPELGLANPSYVAGSENSDELAAWLFNDRYSETTVNSLTYDLVFNGTLPVELPGGQIGWALGGQARQIESRQIVPDDLYNGNTPCAWGDGQQRPLANDDPDFNGCTLNAPGPFGFFGTNPPDYYDQQGYSFFGEAQIPVLDNVNLQAAVRREEFSGGLGDTVYKVSGKWDVFGPLSLRGSYGTNFQAPPITLNPGNVTNVVRAYDRAGGAWLAGRQVTRADVQPETATAWNVGAIWQSQGFSADHDLQIIVDYFNIETEGEIGELAPQNEIANLIFDAGTGLADCAHPLINRVEFNTASCVAGTTGIDDMNVVITDIGNGPGQTSAGFDFQVNYMMPLENADLSFGANGTYTTEQELSAKFLDGVEVAPADDRLGYLNFSSVTFASPEWRANFFANYNRDQHNVRVTARYVSGIEDERGIITPAGYQTGTTDAFAPLDASDIDSSLTFDLTYLYDISDTMRLSASVANVTDEDPPFVRAEFGYDPRLGVDALGRTFEVGIKKTF